MTDNEIEYGIAFEEKASGINDHWNKRILRRFDGPEGVAKRIAWMSHKPQTFRNARLVSRTVSPWKEVDE